MSNTDELLQICQEYKMYVQIGPDRYFVALGKCMAVGNSLADAIENWCQEVEKVYDVASNETAE